MHAQMMEPDEAPSWNQVLVALAAGELRLVLAPEAGGSIASFTRQPAGHGQLSAAALLQPHPQWPRQLRGP
jgi:hypothetical protein